MAISESEWVWYGYAGHLTVGKWCAYHLTTRIGGYLISTVGHYLPGGGRDMDTIGSGDADYFETMVFPCDGEEPSGDPNVLSWSAVEAKHYATSIEAERGHREFCRRYAVAPPHQEGE